MRYGMVIDLKGCIGCQTCAVACKTAHNLPVGLWRNRVLTEGGESIDMAGGEFPNNHLNWRPITCQHCAEPACVEVCPAGATTKDETTGIVHQDTSKCIGCKSCIAACPYEGVRQYIEEEPAYHIDVKLGFADEPEHLKGTVEKCTFCDTRVDAGEVPACMEYCIGHARFWGDLDDPESEVSQLLSEREYKQLLPDEGTGPSVFYLE